MIAHVGPALEALAALLALIPKSPIMGWSVDQVDLDDDTLCSLKDAYHALLVPNLPSEVTRELQKDGIPYEDIFLSGEVVDRITRSDLTELVAAACLIAANGISVDLLHMPNVPKGSPRQSAQGIDVLGAHIDPRGTDIELGEGEHLVICSVKHTISDPTDMRWNLAKSVDETSLSRQYLFEQVRVLHGRLAERGIHAGRLALVLRDFPNPAFVKIVAVGAVDASQISALLAQLTRLPQRDAPTHHFRCVSIPGIANLQQLVSS